ncbi:unnamed protein product [Trichogramma brassicae]|uniref:Uncharacterized protein n=1 Tax=Trichogramma brassicae TaxID=86971 RepID=A0A6H5IFB2_9HYME|nr:unnamed protein product [Trichogramma brassicae]
MDTTNGHDSIIGSSDSGKNFTETPPPCQRAAAAVQRIGSGARRIDKQTIARFCAGKNNRRGRDSGPDQEHAVSRRRSQTSLSENQHVLAVRDKIAGLQYRSFALGRLYTYARRKSGSEQRKRPRGARSIAILESYFLPRASFVGQDGGGGLLSLTILSLTKTRTSARQRYFRVWPRPPVSPRRSPFSSTNFARPACFSLIATSRLCLRAYCRLARDVDFIGPCNGTHDCRVRLSWHCFKLSTRATRAFASTSHNSAAFSCCSEELLVVVVRPRTAAASEIWRARHAVAHGPGSEHELAAQKPTGQEHRLHEQSTNNELGTTCYIDFGPGVDRANHMLGLAVLERNVDAREIERLFATYAEPLWRDIGLTAAAAKPPLATTTTRNKETIVIKPCCCSSIRPTINRKLLSTEPQQQRSPIDEKNKTLLRDYVDLVFGRRNYDTPSPWNVRVWAAFGNLHGGCIEDGVIFDRAFVQAMPPVQYNACITIELMFRTQQQAANSVFVPVRVVAALMRRDVPPTTNDRKNNNYYDDTFVGCLITENELRVKNSRHTKIVCAQLGNNFYYMIHFLPKQPKLYENLRVRHIKSGKSVTVIITGRHRGRVYTGTKIANSFGQKNICSMVADLSTCRGVTRDGRRVLGQAPRFYQWLVIGHELGVARVGEQAPQFIVHGVEIAVISQIIAQINERRRKQFGKITIGKILRPQIIRPERVADVAGRATQQYRLADTSVTSLLMKNTQGARNSCSKKVSVAARPVAAARLENISVARSYESSSKIRSSKIRVRRRRLDQQTMHVVKNKIRVLRSIAPHGAVFVARIRFYAVRKYTIDRAQRIDIVGRRFCHERRERVGFLIGSFESDVATQRALGRALSPVHDDYSFLRKSEQSSVCRFDARSSQFAALDRDSRRASVVITRAFSPRTRI